MRTWRGRDRRERQSADEVLQRERVDKGRDPVIEVRLAWYSTEENRYHVCANCNGYQLIQQEHLRITVEDEAVATGRKICEICDGRTTDGLCDYTVLRITE